MLTSQVQLLTQGNSDSIQRLQTIDCEINLFRLYDLSIEHLMIVCPYTAIKVLVAGVEYNKNVAMLLNHFTKTATVYVAS